MGRGGGTHPGLASWYLEKFQAWGDGDVFERSPLDLLLDHGVESFARRRYPTVRFTRFPTGGHSGAMEHPELLAADLRALLNAVGGPTP